MVGENFNVHLESEEEVVARRALGHITLTTQRLICGPREWRLETIRSIGGAYSFAADRNYLLPHEKRSIDGKTSLWILVTFFVFSHIVAIVWFSLWMINKIFKVGPLFAYKLFIIIGDERILVLEDYRRREVKRLGLAIRYAQRMRLRELRMLKAKDGTNIS